MWVDPNQIRRIQLIQTSNLPCVESNDLIRSMEDSTFELGLGLIYYLTYESARSKEIEESISQSGLSFKVKTFLLFTYIAFFDETHLHAQRQGSPAEIMRTYQQTHFRRRK